VLRTVHESRPTLAPRVEACVDLFVCVERSESGGRIEELDQSTFDRWFTAITQQQTRVSTGVVEVARHGSRPEVAPRATVAENVSQSSFVAQGPIDEQVVCSAGGHVDHGVRQYPIMPRKSSTRLKRR
jgi:hypothetical protein